MESKSNETGDGVHAAAQALMQNPEFMNLFQRALMSEQDHTTTTTATPVNTKTKCASTTASTNKTKILSTSESKAATTENLSQDASELLKRIPKEGDPMRDEWLHSLQKKLQEESTRMAQQELEQVHSDENGQWMYVMPTPGFCIKCAVAGGGKVFINVCQHARIAEPMPLAADVDCMTNSAVENGEVRFRVPLSCGQAKPDKDKAGKPCKVYDVIVNPRTLERCSSDAEFRRFVAALCMQWIKQKSEPTLNIDEFRNLNFKVKGTLEPQRIRISTQPTETNAMHNEIKLPHTHNTATAPTQIHGTLATGKLIEEINDGGTNANNNTSTDIHDESFKSKEATNNCHKDVDVKETLSLTDTKEQQSEATNVNNNSNFCIDDRKTTNSSPSLICIHEEGMYDWSCHKKPTSNGFFRENVPAMYTVEMHIPTINSISEIDVRLSSKKLECFYIDEDNIDDNEDAIATPAALTTTNTQKNKKSKTDSNNAANEKEINPNVDGECKSTIIEERGAVANEPFLSIVFDYPVQEEVVKAKFVKKTSRLKVQLRVKLPDETDPSVTRTDVARDAMEIEEEEAEQLRQEQQRKWEVEKRRRERIDKEEAAVMNERKSYVADLSALQAGELPPTLLLEIDKMPKEQLPAMLMRLEGRVKRGDSIDKLLETMSENAVVALCTHIRDKLSLQPLPAKTANNVENANGTNQANITGKDNKNASNTLPEDTKGNNLKEYNYSKKAEQLFGVEFHNRYLFALDN